jgi:predicted acetyltransferase/RimJ/RimL family protein N-acetyltransferase
MANINFEKATLNHKDLVFEWIEKPHVREFWDNSQEHRDDILSFMKGRTEASHYYDGIFTYWIGSIENEPYCLLMTSEVIDVPDLPNVWRENLSQTGKVYSIDFCIGNEKYLGKGLAGPTLEAFTRFIKETVDFSVDSFMIDPAETNPRAKHVYEKAGFETAAEFIRSNCFFEGINHFLMIKKFTLQPEIVRATTTGYPVVQDMGKLYEHAMSPYCDFSPGWIRRYFNEADRCVFFIKVGEENAGFALINKVGTVPEVDWNMGEFFILGKFQRQSIGQQAATKILDQFEGVWEVTVIPENTQALHFWRKVIIQYTRGNFTKDIKTVDPHNPKRVIFCFKSKKNRKS